jgi:hypothetical protein
VGNNASTRTFDSRLRAGYRLLADQTLSQCNLSGAPQQRLNFLPEPEGIRYRGQGPASCRLASRGEVSYLVPRSEEIDLK